MRMKKEEQHIDSIEYRLRLSFTLNQTKKTLNLSIENIN